MPWLTALGIPAAIYIASMTALCMLVFGEKIDFWAVFSSGFLAMGIYIFHRSSVQACECMQLRHRICAKHRNQLMWLAVVVVLISLFGLLKVHVAAPLLIVGAFAGVVVYGRRTWLPPIRNTMLLKPFAVGISISGFACVLVGMSSEIKGFCAVALLCSADALLCDLVDRSYDHETGCKTLAMELGVDRSWYIAGIAYLISCGLLYFSLNANIGLFFMILFFFPVVTMGRELRMAIDFRPLAVLLLAWLI